MTWPAPGAAARFRGAGATAASWGAPGAAPPGPLIPSRGWGISPPIPGGGVPRDVLGGQLVANQELHQRRLAGTRRPDQEDEVALRDDEVDLRQGVSPVRIRLRDVVEDEDRPTGNGRTAVELGWRARPARPPAAIGQGVNGQDRLRGSSIPGSTIRRRCWTPTAGTALGATCCPEATPTPSTRATGRSAQRRPGEIGT